MFKKIIIVSLLIITIVFSYSIVFAENDSGASSADSIAVSSSSVTSSTKVDDNEYNKLNTAMEFECPEIEASEDAVNRCEYNGGKIFYKKNVNGCEIEPICISHKERPAQLNISPVGNFLARGMIVKSISSSTNSFVGEVWNTKWHINVGNVHIFVLRNGLERPIIDVLGQLKVGEEVGVAGKVIGPGVVEARVVRNYNLLKERVRRFTKEKIKKYRETGSIKNKQISKKENNIHNNVLLSKERLAKTTEIRSMIQNILRQIEAIREQVKIKQEQ